MKPIRIVQKRRKNEYDQRKSPRDKQIDYRNRSKIKTFVVMDICSSQSGLCGYSFFNGSIRGVMAGAPLPAGGLILGALVMETSIAMVILSWVLKYKVNRWVTTVIGALNILAVVRGGHGLYYAFFATVEVACMLLIIWFAWRWHNPEG
jgi:hypothetical protein